MATTVTVTCDRCGSIVPKGDDLHTVSVDVRTRGYDSILRETWELCCSCFGDTREVLHDRAGEPSDTWSRPPEPLGKDQEEAMAKLGMLAALVAPSAAQREDDPIAEARRVIEGDGPEGEWKEII